MGPSWREGSWADGWGQGQLCASVDEAAAVPGGLEPSRGLQGAAAGAPAPLPTAEPLPAHSCWRLSPAALVLCAGDKRALACSHGNGRQTQKALPRAVPPSKLPSCTSSCLGLFSQRVLRLLADPRRNLCYRRCPGSPRPTLQPAQPSLLSSPAQP